MTYSIAELNQMSQETFIEALGAVFEHSPAIAEQAWTTRPFLNIADLHQKMFAVVDVMSQEEKLALIRLHPDLGSRVKMAEASVNEQAGAGLDRLTAEEFERFQQLNQAYRQKFGFPFIVAVKNHTKASILQTFEQRLHYSTDAEMEQALKEIFQITRLRLEQLITQTA